jgi:oligoendopeptidase F
VAEALKTTGAEDVRWDLSELYASPTDTRIEADLATALEGARRFEEKYKGRIGEMQPDEFVAMMRQLEENYEVSSHSGLYAHLLHSQNTADAAAGRLVARVREAGAERGRHLVFFSLEMAQISDEQAERLYADPQAAVYRHTVEDYRKYRPHQLSEVEERLLNDLSPVGAGAWTRLFEELCAAIKATVDGREMPLAQALTLLREPERDVRRSASGAITEGLRRDIRTRAYIFNVILQEHSISDRLRSFPSWISSRNLANETSDEAVAALVEAVTGRYDIVARYYRVKKGLLGLDELHEWDRYAPVENVTRDLDWQGARDLVLTSYHRFSARAGRLVQDFFEKPWIDAPVVEGKEMGAYCAGATPRLHPYVLLNYTGKLYDALTLAHELGHGLHDRLASRQHIFDYHPPLTLAETASVFGETLTFDRILAEEKDDRIKLAMLCNQVESAMATIFRQVAFNRFEDAAHTRRRTEGELSADQLAEVWQEKLQAMFGDSLSLTDEHMAWWSYVEHFIHTPGYVYAYAFGNLLALSIYRRYQEVGENFVDSYLDFLAAGGSRRPDELVRGIGMDITDPGFWDAGLKILDGMVSEVERLAGSRSGQ